MRTIALAIALQLALTANVWGQEEAFEEKDYWFNVLYPKAFFTPTEGLSIGGYYAFVQPVRFQDFENPPPYRASLSLDGQISTSGSRFLKFDARAPGLSERWRYSGQLLARRRAKDNYFGLGNATVREADSITDAQPNYYRAIRNRYVARGEVQRKIVGPLWIMAGFNVERWRIGPPEGPSLIGKDSASGVDPTIGVETNDFSLRFGLIFDTRNDEVAPERGVLIQAIVGAADADVAGDVTYTRTTVSASGFITATPRLQFAARVVGQHMSGTPPFGTYYHIDGGNQFYNTLGGSSSHRALINNRFLGRDQLFTNLEVRYTIFAIPTLYRISVLGFFDAGRVFQTEEFRLTTDDFKVGGGSGLFVQVGRAGLVGVTLGVGPDGAIPEFHTRWTF